MFPCCYSADIHCWRTSVIFVASHKLTVIQKIATRIGLGPSDDGKVRAVAQGWPFVFSLPDGVFKLRNREYCRTSRTADSRGISLSTCHPVPPRTLIEWTTFSPS